MSRVTVFNEILFEIQQPHPLSGFVEGLRDGTGGGGRRTWLEIARNSCHRAAHEGRLTFEYVLDAASAEVLAETDVLELRKSLIKLAALCVKWATEIDRRQMQVGSPEQP
jgi:hypothetical protein